MIQRLPFVLIGLGIGMTVLAIVLLGIDMLGNHGKVAARHIHHEFPQCSNTCHG